MLFGDFTAPAKNLRLRTGGFGFFDVAGAIVEQRQTRPADLVVTAIANRGSARKVLRLRPPSTGSET